MLVICEDCAKKYNIDESRIKARRARFTCNECGHIIIIDKADLSRPLISKKKSGYPPSPTIDLLKEMEVQEGPQPTAGSNPAADLQEEEADPPGRHVQRKNRGIPLFVYFILTVLLALVCVVLMGYFHAAYFGAGLLSGNMGGNSGTHGGILMQSLLLFGAGWFIMFLFFSVFAHFMLQKFNLLIKDANQLGAGGYNIAIEKKGPREVRNLAFALERIRKRLLEADSG
jgi:hypothetical protein